MITVKSNIQPKVFGEALVITISELVGIVSCKNDWSSMVLLKMKKVALTNEI